MTDYIRQVSLILFLCSSYVGTPYCHPLPFMSGRKKRPRIDVFPFVSFTAAAELLGA